MHRLVPLFYPRTLITLSSPIVPTLIFPVYMYIWYGVQTVNFYIACYLAINFTNFIDIV